MAELLNKTSKKHIKLRSQHIFGRHSGSSNTVLCNLKASRLHASILWNGSHWLIQDTSSNGTFINKKPIITGLKTRLVIGDVLQFGALNAEKWLFTNDDAPKNMLVSISNENTTIELQGIVALPNDKSPEVTFYQTQNGQWVYEDQSGINTLEPGIKIIINEKSWYFVNSDTFDETKNADFLDDTQIIQTQVHFNASKDEEHVSLFIQYMNQMIDLGERTHHYLLLFLARKRLEDKLAGITDTEQGWIEKDILSKQIGLDENHINILIYRFRKQLIKAKPSAASLLQLIERRRGGIRMALSSIEINGSES